MADSIGIRMIYQERRRQIEIEGFTAEHDSQHQKGELVMAATALVKAIQNQIAEQVTEILEEKGF